MKRFERYPITLYNSLKKEKEVFRPLHPPFVGLYVCGPTVYGEPHLGHARAAVTFDVVVRYLEHLGYNVRYVRNITDVGHLEDEEHDRGEDKIAKKARLEKLEPMEIAQYYTRLYQEGMDAMNCLRPDIEPTATGHIIEQIELVKKLLDAEIAYERDGNVYFDLGAYTADHDYGTLSGKILDDLIVGSRDTEGLEEKKGPHDFALWKRATDSHIMRWPSPWGEGFPGWHTECSAMSTKYLGEQFDIHGGGLDLQFPHHEAEIAQCRMAYGKHPAKYWMHNNMITIDGAKMSKSAGNFVTLNQLFSGDHELLDRSYSPSVIRFLILQSHYRSKIDFSNEALQAAEKGMKKLFAAAELLHSMKPGLKGMSENQSTATTALDQEICTHLDQFYQHMSDDFNTARALAELFEMASKVHALQQGQLPLDQLSSEGLQDLQTAFHVALPDILGLTPSFTAGESNQLQQKLMELLIDLRSDARSRKDFALSDQIRDRLEEAGVRLKDDKSGKTFYEIDP